MSEYKDNPVAMPGQFFKLDRPIDWSPTEDYNKWLREVSEDYRKYAEGQEDQGDVMSRQVGGNHYKKAIQPWDIIEEWQLNYWAGNIIKYVLRYPYKNGVEDLEKAKHYLEYLIKKEKDAATATRD